MSEGRHSRETQELVAPGEVAEVRVARLERQLGDLQRAHTRLEHRLAETEQECERRGQEVQALSSHITTLLQAGQTAAEYASFRKRCQRQLEALRDGLRGLAADPRLHPELAPLVRVLLQQAEERQG